MNTQRAAIRRNPTKAKSSQSARGGVLAAGDPTANLDDEMDWLDDSEETLPDLEREIGIADWLDPQTGEPAEGQSPPHLEAE